jgi:hypothetical protein
VPVFVKDERRVLFVHVPKTGGSAVEDAFVEDGWEAHFLDRTSRRQPVQQLRRCSPQHMHAALLEQTLRLDRLDLSFAVVRDPLARFRSEYLWRHREDPTMDATEVEGWGRRLLEKFTHDPFVRDNHIRPQSEFVLEGTRVHRYEDGLQAAVDDVYRSLGLPGTASVPRPPRPPVSSAEVPLSTGLAERLREFYREDFERFGYR